MYAETYEFLIVSADLRIEQVLREILPLEDSAYHFTTVSGFGEGEELLSRKNLAVLIDGRMGAERMGAMVQKIQEKKEQDEEILETVLILWDDREKPEAKWLSKADHLWMMEKGQEEFLLRAYFRQLASGMKKNADAKKQEICFRTLIDSSRDLIWFKDVDGRHLMVNDTFCGFVNKSKQQIFRQGHCYIWDASKEDEKVCLDSDRKIMEGRKTQKFEEQVHTNQGDYIIQSYKSPLIQDGTIFGTCGIGQDITDERNMEKKLQMILDHIPFAVAVVSREEILTYKNRMFDVYFPSAKDAAGKSVGELKEKLSFPETVAEGGTVEISMQTGDEEPVWFSYCEKKILDAFDSQIEKMLVIQNITASKKLEQQKERMAYTDYLTGLSNRRGMLRILENETDIHGLTVILFDVDNFKSINDSLGHGVGDDVLKKFAGLLKKTFAADFVARYGGDEFLVITRLNRRDAVEARMTALREEAEQMEFGMGRRRGISFSCGIAIGALTECRSAEELIEMSDEAMYYIKKHGKHGYWFYSDPFDIL